MNFLCFVLGTGKRDQIRCGRQARGETNCDLVLCSSFPQWTIFRDFSWQLEWKKPRRAAIPALASTPVITVVATEPFESTEMARESRSRLCQSAGMFSSFSSAFLSRHSFLPTGRAMDSSLGKKLNVCHVLVRPNHHYNLLARHRASTFRPKRCRYGSKVALSMLLMGHGMQCPVHCTRRRRLLPRGHRYLVSLHRSQGRMIRIYG